jgi:TonB family protein
MGAPLDNTSRLFRRNFTVAAVLYVGLIVGVVVCDGIFSHFRPPPRVAVELMVPADILGELPEGSGYGRGAYTAPAEPPPGEPDGGNEITGMLQQPVEPPPAPPEPQVAPPPPAPNPQPVTHQEVAVPKPPPAAKPKPTTTKTTKTSTTKPASTTTSKPATTTSKTTTKTTAKAGSPQGTGLSADDIKKRFASRLPSSGSGDGSPYGDNRPKGGGTAKIGTGSPDGDPNGVIGGIGKGSPYWWYYEHIRNKMYAAWQRPDRVEGMRKGIVTTITLTVARDGSILDARLTGRSGNNLMDDSALEAAKSVSRINPLPDGYTRDSQANITVNFELEG